MYLLPVDDSTLISHLTERHLDEFEAYAHMKHLETKCTHEASTCVWRDSIYTNVCYTCMLHMCVTHVCTHVCYTCMLPMYVTHVCYPCMLPMYVTHVCYTCMLHVYVAHVCCETQSKTVSTEIAEPPKSTKSRNSDSSGISRYKFKLRF